MRLGPGESRAWSPGRDRVVARPSSPGTQWWGTLLVESPPVLTLSPSPRVQLPFSQAGVLIERSSGYVKVVAKLGLVFTWNQDDSLTVRAGRGQTEPPRAWRCPLLTPFPGRHKGFWARRVRRLVPHIAGE